MDEVPKGGTPVRYPLLQALLEQRGIALKATYSTRDVASIFDVSIRAIQSRIQSGELRARRLPGRAKFLSQDLENYLKDSLER